MNLYLDYESAVKHLPVCQAEIDKHMELKAKNEKAAQKSFEQCDTDGFLSQNSSTSMAGKHAVLADVEGHCGKHVFRVLVESDTGFVVCRKMYTLRSFKGGGSRKVWPFELPNGSTEWVKYRADRDYSKYGLEVAYEIADAKVGHSDDDPLCKLPVQRGMPTGPTHYYPIRTDYSVET